MLRIASKDSQPDLACTYRLGKDSCQESSNLIYIGSIIPFIERLISIVTTIIIKYYTLLILYVFNSSLPIIKAYSNYL
jgi:hypothetical protein